MIEKKAEIVHGPFHPHLEGLLLSLLERKASEGSLDSLAVVVPSEEMRLYLKERITQAGDLVLAGVYLLTAYRLARLIPDGDQSLEREAYDGPTMEALLKDLLQDRSYPPAIREMAGTSGGPGKIRETMRDLEEAGIPESSLGTETIYRIYRELSRNRRKHGLETFSDPVALGITAARRSSFLHRLDSLHIYGFYDMTQQQMELMAACSTAVRTIFYLPHVQGHPAGEFSGLFLNDLQQCLEGSGLEVNQEAAAGGDHHGACTQELLSDLFFPVPRENADREEIRLISASGPRGEVEMAAKEILRCHEDLGIPLEEVGVVVRSLEIYAPFLEEVFTEHRIPFWSNSRRSSLDHPLIRTITALWRVLTGDFRGVDVAEFLVSPYLALGEKEAEAVGYLIRRAGHLNGLVRWKRLLEISLFDRDENRDENLDRLPEEEALRGARKAIRSLLEEDEKLPRKASWEKMSRSAEEQLDRWLDDGSMDDREIKLLEESLARLRHLGGLDGILAPPDRISFFEVLTGHLSAMGIALGTPSAPGAAVLDAAGARGRSFGALILLGLNERSWPPPSREDPFLSDELRKELSIRHGVRLGLSENRPLEERLLFWLILASARRSLTLIWQRSDGEGRPAVRSWYIHELARALGHPGGRLPEGRVAELPRLMGNRFGKEIYPDSFLTPSEWIHRLIRSGIDPAPLWSLRGIPAGELSRACSSAVSLEEPGRRLTGWDGYVGRRNMDPAYRELCRVGFSPTSLEMYARCPFSFFASKLLKLEGVESRVAGGELSSREMGGLMHGILYRFFKGWLTREGEGSREVSDLLEEAAVEVFRRYEKVALTPLPLLWERDKEVLKALALDYVQQEVGELERTGFQPAELESCMEARLPPECPPPAGGLLIKGYPDRMDLGSGETRVIDYKFTGSASYSGGSLARDSARGKKLQPAAYMLMAAGRAPMDTPVTFQFHVLWPGGEDRVKKISLEPDFWQTAEGMSTGKALAAILDGIRRGEFFINPEAPDNLCRSCSFDGLCRRFHRPTRYRLAADSRSRVLSEKIDHGSKGDRDG